MSSEIFAKMNCSVARALSEVGERWSLLIVREAFLGSTRFEQFHSRLGVARNILTARLEVLTEAGIFDRIVTSTNARIYDYQLTDKGRDLLSVIAAIMHWGDKWANPDVGPPIVLVDIKTGQPVPQVLLRRSKGEPIPAHDISIKAGRGATPRTRARLAAQIL